MEKYRQYLINNKSRHIKKIQEFLAQPCLPSEQIGGDESAEILMRYYQELGCTEITKLKTDGMPGVWAYLDQGAKKTIINYCMLDTKPATLKGWISPPFEANIVNKENFGDVIIARGAQGRKAPYISCLNALETLQKIDGKLPVNIMFIAESEENGGSPHFKEFVKKYEDRLKTADAAFCPGAVQSVDGTFKLTLGYKGLVNLKLTSSGLKWGKGPQNTATHAMANCLIESPTWRIIHALSVLTDEQTNAIVVSDFFKEEKPVTEYERQKAEELAARFEGKHWKQFLPGIGTDVKSDNDEIDNVSAILKYWYSPSFNINGLASGYTGPGTEVFRLPKEAWATCDIRLPRGMSALKTIERVKQTLIDKGFGDIDVQVVAAYEPFQTDINSDFANTITELLDERKIPIDVWQFVAGGGPWSLFSEYNIPVLFDIGIGHGGFAGGLNEYLVVESNDKIAGIIDSELFFVEFMKRYAEK